MASAQFADPDVKNELDLERVAGGFLTGVLKVTGLALLAVIAGYSAGIAQENYRASKAAHNLNQ